MAHINTTNIARRDRQNRYRLMAAIYKFTEADTNVWLAANEVAENIDMPGDDFEKAFRYLVAEGLISLYGAGYTCNLTHEGIKAIETALTDPDRETEHFASVNSIAPARGKIN
jgi:hypothetical protein